MLAGLRPARRGRVGGVLDQRHHPAGHEPGGPDRGAGPGHLADLDDPAPVGHVDPAKRIVLHCKSGVRSAEALAIVKNAGFADAVHVGGGVLAWINQVDPSLPSY